MAESRVARHSFGLARIQQDLQGTAWFLQATIDDYESAAHREAGDLVSAIYFAIDRLRELETDIAKLPLRHDVEPTITPEDTLREAIADQDRLEGLGK